MSFILGATVVVDIILLPITYFVLKCFFFAVATYVFIKYDDIFIVSFVIVVVYIVVLKCQQSSPIPGGCNS